MAAPDLDELIGALRNRPPVPPRSMDDVATTATGSAVPGAGDGRSPLEVYLRW